MNSAPARVNTHISPSATRTDLTYTLAGVKEGTPAFFRVVPADNIQGPTDAAYMVNTLKVKKVVVFDQDSVFGHGNYAAVKAFFTGHNVSEISVPLNRTRSSRMSTTCAVTAVNPINTRTARRARIGRL